MTIEERIAALTPRQRKKLATLQATCSIRLPDKTIVKCCTFINPAGIDGETQRIDYIPREEQEELINRYLMPALERGITEMCDRDEKFRERMLKLVMEREQKCEEQIK